MRYSSWACVLVLFFGVQASAQDINEQTVPQIVIQGELSEGSENRFGNEPVEAGGVPSCRAYTKNGNGGYIAMQASPFDGSFQWGAYMYRPSDNYGWWTALVTVNGVPMDQKSQPYPPHGSLRTSSAPPGSTVTIAATHIYARISWYPEYLPEWGWHMRFTVVPVLATGTASCMMPFFGQ